MNEVQEYVGGGFRVRTTTDADGTVWFVARDIAEGLEYPESTIKQMNNLCGTVPEVWKGHKRIMTPGGEQNMLCLTEQGVYFFLGRSDKAKALPYQMWIAGEVVPSIRKHGLYATPATIDAMLQDPDLIIRLAQELKAERVKREELEAKVEEDRPKVIFADAVDASKKSILIGNLAKFLAQNGVNIGQNRLFAWLREHGYLMSCRGERWNMPTQWSVERGYFDVKTRVINNADGSTRITHTTKVTGKGQIHLVNVFLRNEEAR